MLRNSTQHVCLNGLAVLANAITKLFVAALLVVLPASARNRALTASAQPANTIRVCVNSSNYAAASLNLAKTITSRMFLTAGVSLEWHSFAAAACQGSHPDQTVIVDISTDQPAGEHVGAMAYALPYEGAHIVVLFDRIQRSAAGPIMLSAMLAHVMTHEITHLLQGISRHSETGVMKAHWDAKDFADMGRAPLPFAPEDIELIQLGLSRRSSAAGICRARLR
jgi:hypothetical protein